MGAAASSAEGGAASPDASASALAAGLVARAPAVLEAAARVPVPDAARVRAAGFLAAGAVASGA
ncbi:hypothetical protein, partial [Cohnella sp. REN36]|uniref:hypothetical protein n=1 Tax=Cohnella sp. REN36 TaxID=2887347 RepID=UPI001D13FB6D